MHRIMILGAAGAGKSTLARRLGAANGLPVYPLDQVFWTSGWVRRPEDEKLRMVAKLESRSEWIIEGGIAESYPNRLARAQVVIWLDLPVSTRLIRLIGRLWRHRAHPRSDLPEGCDEPLSWQRVEFLYQVWKERQLVRAEIIRALEKASVTAKLCHLRSPKEVDAFMNGFNAQ